MFGKSKWWANLTGKSMSIRAGRHTFSGDSIKFSGDVVGGKIVVNGVEQTDMVATPNIMIEIIGGTVDKVESNLGITCGNVTGNVKAGMEVTCGNVGGNVDAGMGVEAQDIGGDADAGMDIKARDIKGDAKAGMSIKCNSVGGKTKSAF